MAKGILIDVGFTSDVKEYIAQIEKDFSKVNWGDTIGLSDAFDKQVNDTKDKIKELKKEIENIGKSRVLDTDLQKQFLDLTKSVQDLKKGFDLLIQTAPKNRQAGLTSQLNQINQGLKETYEVTTNVAEALGGFEQKRIVNKQALKDLEELYDTLEKARRATDLFDKTTKQIGNKSYSDTDDILNDIIAKYKVYNDLSEKSLDLQDKKQTKNVAKDLLETQALITTTLTDLNRLIVTYKSFSSGTSWENVTPFIGKKKTLLSIQEEAIDELDNMKKYIAQKIADVQAEYTKLGGGNLSQIYVKATAKEEPIRIPVSVAPGSKKKILTECIELVNKITADLTETPIQVEIQLVTAYQSSKNAALIKDLQEQISKLEKDASNSISNGLSEAEASKITQVSEDMKKLLDRLNKQIDNAMIFTVDVRTQAAINAVRSFVADAKAKLKEIAQNPPSIEPGFNITEQAKKSFLKELNKFIRDTNKQIEKIQVEKSKLGNDVFTGYIDQLKSAVKSLKELKSTINFKENVTKATQQQAEEQSKLFNVTKDQVVQDIQVIQKELFKAFDPDDNNLSKWAIKLLDTLDSAALKISQLFSPNHSNLSSFLEDIAYSDRLKQKWESNNATLEHGGILLKNGQVKGLTSTDEHGSTRYSNPSYHDDKIEQILATIHSHSGDAIWLPSEQDLTNAINRKLDYAITSTLNEVATFNVKDFVAKYGENFDFSEIFKIERQGYSQEALTKEIGKMYLDIIPTFIQNAGDDIKKLMANSPISSSGLSIKGWMKNAFMDADEATFMRGGSQHDFFTKLVENLGIIPSEFYKFQKYTNNKFQLTQEDSPNHEYRSRGAFLSLFQRNFIDAFKTVGINFSDYFKIQSHEDFAKHMPFGLEDEIRKNNQINIADVTKSINQIIDNVNKLNELDAEKKQANEQLLTDINNNLQSIVQELPNLTKAMNDLSVKGVQIADKQPKQTSSSTESLPNKSETKFKKYSEEVALGLERISRAKILEKAGLMNGNAFNPDQLGNGSARLGKAYQLVSASDSLWEGIVKKGLLQEGSQNFKEIGNAIEIYIKEFLSHFNLTVDEIKNQLSEISKFNPQDVGFKPHSKNNEKGSWQNYHSIDEKGHANDKFEGEYTYKTYARFADPRNLNQSNIIAIMKALSSAGFKGQLKVPGTSGTDRFITSSDQLVIHGINSKMQQLAYDILNKNFGELFSSLKAGFDKTKTKTTSGASFSEIAINKGRDNLVEQARQLLYTQQTETVEPAIDNATNKTQKLVEQFETLKTLIKDAFGNKDIPLLDKYLDEISKINQQLNDDHVAGKRKRSSYIKATQASIDELKNEIVTSSSPKQDKTITDEAKQINKVTTAIEKKTKAFDKELNKVNEVVDKEKEKLKELKEYLEKDVVTAIKTKTGAFQEEKGVVKGVVDSELASLGRLTKEQEKATKEQAEQKNLNQAEVFLSKNYDAIRSKFVSMLQQNNQTLVDASFEPTKKGLIEIKALIKDADDSYKAFTYTIKNLKGANPFTLVGAKEGYKFDKAGSGYEKWIEQLKEADKEIKQIGLVRPNTPEWEEVVKLATRFGLEMKDIDKVVRNVDHGIESFQFYNKQGDRTTLGINSEEVLWEREYIMQITDDINKFKKEIAGLPNIIKNGITNYDANAGIKYADALKNIATLWQKINDYRQAELIPKDELNTLDSLFGGSAQTVQSKLDAILPTDKRMPEVVQQVNTLKQAFTDLFQSVYNGGYSVEDAESKFTTLIAQAKELYTVIGQDPSKLANTVSVDKLLQKIGDTLNNNTNMSSKFRLQLNGLVKEIQDMGHQIPNDKFKEFNERFQRINSQIHLANQTGKSFFDQLGTSLGRSIIQFANMYLSLYRVVGYIRQGVTQVQNLDKALTTMSYTMNISNAQINEMGKDILAMSKDLKISVDNVSQIYQIYANMQTTTEEMMKTARPTAILANLSGVDASTAADQIQGVLNQFGLLADESEHIIDVYDYISSNISVDYSKGIAGMSEAVKNVGNVANEAGLSFEQLSSIIAKVMEKTRQDGASIGNALRTILVRISKANKLAGDEVDNATVGNAAKALHKIGIEVYTASGEFREFDTIMSELAEKWDDLSDAEQANISFQIAATRQTSTLRAILQQYTDSMKLAAEATVTEGNALANQEKYESSIAGKMQALQNQISEFWINTISSDTIKGILDELNTFVGELNEANSGASALVKTLGGLVEILLKIANALPDGSALGALLGMTKLRNTFASVNPAGGINVTTGIFNRVIGSNRVNANDLKLFQDYAKTLENNVIPKTEEAIISSDGWKNSMANASKQAQQMAITAGTSGQSVNDAMRSMELGLTKTTIAAKALNVALSIGITAAITGVITLIDKVIHYEENARKKTAQALETTKKHREEYEKEQLALSDIINKYKEYAQQLKDVKGNEEKTIEVRNNLLDLQKKINEQYGTTAKRIDLINGQYERELELFELIGKQNTEEWLNNNLGSYKEQVANSKITGWSQKFIDESVSFLDAWTKDTDTYYRLTLKEMFKEAGYSYDEAEELNANEYYKVFQDVLTYHRNNESTNSYIIKYKDDILKAWNEYTQNSESSLNNAFVNFDEMQKYEKVAAMSVNPEAYQQLEDYIALLQKALSEENYDQFNSLILGGSGVHLDYQKLSDEQEAGFSYLYKQIEDIQLEKQATIEQYRQDAIDAFRGYYNGPIDMRSFYEERINQWGIDTQKETLAFSAAIDDARDKGIKDINKIFDLYQKRLNEAEGNTNKVISSAYQEWLELDTKLYSDESKGEYYTNNTLIEAYKSATSNYQQTLADLTQGSKKVNFGELVTSLDTNEFFKQLGMDSFESYIDGFEEDAKILKTLSEQDATKYIQGFGEKTEALSAYLRDVLKKVLGNMDLESLKGGSFDLLEDTFFNINADLFGVSESVLKIEDSYWELRNLQNQVKNGTGIAQKDAVALMNKYQDLYGAIKKTYTEIDEESGEVIVKYEFQQDAIDNLVNSYATMSNTAISSLDNLGIYAEETIKWLQMMELEILQMTLDMANFSTSADTLLELYNRRDGSLHNAIAGLPEDIQEEINTIISTASARVNTLQISLKKKLKVQDDDGTGNSTDKDKDSDNKSQYDWLDSYLDKRNRALQKEQTLYDNLAKNDPIDLIKDRLKEYQKGGNVNLLLRPEIDTEELKKAKWDDIEDGIATVYSKTFSNKAEDIAINFTPIIVDPETGEYQGVMSPKKFDKYCEDVIAGVRKDDLNLQIGAAFTGKNAIAEAEKAAIDIHLLHQQLMNDYSIEERYYASLNASLEEQNNLLDEKIAAYTRANEEYEKVRMHDENSLLYKNLVDAFGGSKSKANAIIQKIINRESVELTEYTSDQASAISAIADTFNKALDAENTILEAQYQIHDNILKQHSNDIELITKQYDHVLNEFANRQAELEHYQTMRTNAGMMENQKYYIALLDNESRELEANIQKRDELINKIQDMNPITEDELELWWDTKNTIDETTKSIWESQEAIESYQMSMKQLSWDLNDRIRDITGNLRNETEFLIDTLGTFEKDMYSYERQYLGNDAEKTKIYNGQMSAEGLSTLALRRVRAKSFREDIDAINDEIEEARADYISNTANTTYLDRLNDLISERQSLIESYNDEREAIVQLVQEGYDKQLESLDAITNKYIEAKNAEHDLFEYQRNIAKQTKNIANIRKMMSAYAGDMSEEARSKLQTLQVQLNEAEEGLSDTQYQRTIEDQQRIFDHLYQSLSDYFADIMEKPEKVLKSTESLVNDNMPQIRETLDKTMDFYNSEVSQSLKNILNENGLKGVKQNIATADGDIQGITQSVVNQTGELEEYYAKYHLEPTSETDLKKRMQVLYGDAKGSFTDYFNRFNTKLGNVNDAITDANQRAKLFSELAGYISDAFILGLDSFTNGTVTRSDNAILTPISMAQSSLSNNVDTVNKWLGISGISGKDIFSNSISPTSVEKKSDVTVNNSMSPTIVVNGVSNVSDFIKEFQKNKAAEAMVQSMTIGLLNGNSAMTKYKYKV